MWLCAALSCPGRSAAPLLRCRAGAHLSKTCLVAIWVPALRRNASRVAACPGRVCCNEALAMTEQGRNRSSTRTSIADTVSRSRGLNCPSSASLSHPLEIEGAGKTGRRRHPKSRVRKRLRTGGPQVWPEQPGLPCADGFNGFLRALPGERCTIAPVALQMADVRARSGEPHHRKTWRTGSGRQDHTTSPSAHVLAGIPTTGVRSPSRPCKDAVSAVSYRAACCSRSTVKDSRPAADLARRRNRGHRPLARVS